MKMIHQSTSNDKFKNKWGFIIACIGSSVGMANIWLFPYRIGEFGGAAFLIPYILFVILIGYTGVIGEMAFGRSMQTGPLGAFTKAFQMKKKDSRVGELIGLIPVIGSLGIAIGYSVVIGWILRYFFASISGSIIQTKDPGAEFGALAQNFGSIPWHTLGLVIVLLCMSFGISKGIETINKFMGSFPAFFVLFLLLAVQVARLPGAFAGYEYMFRPDWSAMLNPKTWVYAMGQAFFSLSLAGSGTVVYGSYLNKDVDILNSARNVALFDTLAAILAGISDVSSCRFCLQHGAELRSGTFVYYNPDRHTEFTIWSCVCDHLFPGSFICRDHFTDEFIRKSCRSITDQISSVTLHRAHNCRDRHLRRWCFCRRRSFKFMDGQHFHLRHSAWRTSCRYYDVLDLRK